MSPSPAQSWTRYFPTGGYRYGSNDNVRVSDAERAEVADLLGRHYGDGRLDKQEFDDRVSRAMSAKTRADLDGLFDDLPGLDAPDGAAGGDDRGSPGGFGGPGGFGSPDTIGGLAGPRRHYRVGRRRGPGAHPVLIIVAAVILASLFWHGLHAIFFVPWLALVVLVFAVVYASRRARR